MSEPRSTEQADAEQGSVFGNLPDSRPGARSPRRDAAYKRAADGGQRAKAQSTRAAPKSKAKPKAAPGRRAEPSGVDEPWRAREPSAGDAGEAANSAARRPEPDEGAGLEDLAWAGIAAAAEAATLGVRLASRAMEALRKPVDRR